MIPAGVQQMSNTHMETAADGQGWMCTVYQGLRGFFRRLWTAEDALPAERRMQEA
jgi:hypothetical protein